MANSSFLRAYEAEMGTFTDAPDIYHRASACAIFGALLTRYKYRVVLNTGVPPRWTNLWVLLVGDSGNSRKSTALGMANEVLMRVDEAMLAPTDGSPEGFLQFLVRRHNAELNNASCVLVSSEFANMLASMRKSYAEQTKTLLMELYDVLPVYKRALAKQQWEIPRPRVSLFGAIATELLPSMSDQNDWLGGFFSRCLFIPATRTRTLEVPKSPEDKCYQKHADALWKCLRYFREAQRKAKRPRFDYHPDALKVVRQLPKLPQEPNLSNSLSRGHVHLMKLAAVEQVDEDPTATLIGKAATERAMDLIMYWWEHVPDLVDECFVRNREDFEGDRLAKRIYRYLLKRVGPGKPVEYAEVMRAVALSSDHMRKAVLSLYEAGMVEQQHNEELDTVSLVAKVVPRVA